MTERRPIGLDLDGTIVVYDDVFHRHAVDLFSMPNDVGTTKTAVRGWLRTSPGGERRWRELQALVYGPKLREAAFAPGLTDFLAACRRDDIRVRIISHKTEFAVAAPTLSLHAAARDWLEHKGFFDPHGLGLRPEDVFFEPTRQAKIERVVEQGCSLFVDDLEEVFADPSFPVDVEPWLYAPGEPQNLAGPVRRFSEWSVVLRRAHELLGRR